MSLTAAFSEASCNPTPTSTSSLMRWEVPSRFACYSGMRLSTSNLRVGWSISCSEVAERVPGKHSKGCQEGGNNDHDSRNAIHG